MVRVAAVPRSERQDGRLSALRPRGVEPLAGGTPLVLDEGDVAELRGLNDEVSLDEVAEVYLPLSRLLNLYVTATQSLHRVTDTFLGRPGCRT